MLVTISLIETGNPRQRLVHSQNCRLANKLMDESEFFRTRLSFEGRFLVVRSPNHFNAEYSEAKRISLQNSSILEGHSTEGRQHRVQAAQHYFK